jgi:alpha-tubulin suppressor-like RCC1 family protein
MAGNGFTIGLQADGTLWGWGQGPYNGSSAGNVTSPTRIGTASNWALIHTSNRATHSFAINTSGELYAWGAGGSGRLGNNSTSSVTSPVRIGTDSDWTCASAGQAHSAGVRGGGVRGGSLMTWGINYPGSTYGQLGNGNTSGTVSVPTRVGTASWVHAAAGGNSTAAIAPSGELFHCGNVSMGTGGGASSSTLVPLGTGYRVPD